DGGLLLLGSVAQVEMLEAVGALTRESGQRRSAVLARVHGRDLESFVKEAAARIKSEVIFPPGYNFEFGGQFQQLQQAKRRLAFILPLALISIFVLVFMGFGNLRQAELVSAC